MHLRLKDNAASIQALWFDSSVWTRAEAEAWAAENDFSPVAWRTREDENDDITHYIAVLFQPDEAVEDSFATISDDFPAGISATTAQRKEAQMNHILKSGTQSDEDPFTFVMSTETEDRDGDIIRQKGIDLSNFRKNPVALFGHDSHQPIGCWKNVRIEGKKMLGDLQLAARGTSDFIDTLYKLIEQRILSAVSIGFSVKEYSILERGVDFIKTELLECSLVSIPANQEALRVKAKKAATSEQALNIILGDKGLSSARVGTTPTGSTSPAAPSSGRTPSSQKGNRMNVAEKIKADEQRYVAVQDRLTELKAIAEGDERDLNEEEMEELDVLRGEQETIDKRLKAYRDLEAGLAKKAIPVTTPTTPKPAARPAPVAASAAKKGQGGGLLIKSIAAAVIAKMTDAPLSEVLDDMYGANDDLKAIKAAAKTYLGRQQKTAVDAADTTTSGWAADLVRNDIQGFLNDMAPASVYAALTMRSDVMSLDFGTANSVTIPRRNRATPATGAEIGGSWVGEGGVIPVKQMALGSQTLNRYKLAVISAFTNELMQQSVPNIETLVRAAIIEDTALVVDSALLDASAVVPGVRPGGLMNGVTGTASAGNTAANVITDLKVLFAAMSAIPGSHPVLIMNSNHLLGLSTVTTAAGGFMFRDEVASGMLLGVPLITSTTVPMGTVLIVDANSFAAANANPNFSVSDQAALVMANADDTAPTQAGDATDHTGGDLGTEEQVPPDGGIVLTGDTTGAPTGSSVTGYHAQSMWQQYQTAVRMVMPASWGLIRPGTVAAITGVAW